MKSQFNKIMKIEDPVKRTEAFHRLQFPHLYIEVDEDIRLEELRIENEKEMAKAKKKEKIKKKALKRASGMNDPVVANRIMTIENYDEIISDFNDEGNYDLAKEIKKMRIYLKANYDSMKERSWFDNVEKTDKLIIEYFKIKL